MAILAAFAMRGMSKFRSRMARKKNKLGNMKSIYAPAVAVVDRWIQKNFQSQGALAGDGKKWAPLAAATIRGRRKSKKALSRKVKAARKAAGSGGSVDVLQDKGNLRIKWKHAWGRDSVAVQSGVPYGMVHQVGSKKKGIPQRRVTPLKRQVAKQIKAAVRQAVRSALR